MSSVEERLDDPVEQHRTELSAMLGRQRRAFLADGPPSVALTVARLRTHRRLKRDGASSA